MSRPLIFTCFFFSIYSFYLKITRRALKALDKSALAATKDKNIIPFFFQIIISTYIRDTKWKLLKFSNFRYETREIVSRRNEKIIVKNQK